MKYSNKFEFVEMDLLLEGIFRKYGYDFRNYEHDFIKSRLAKRMETEQISTISGLQEKMFHSRNCMDQFLLDVSVNGNPMLAPADFYLAFRNKIIPQLRTYPFVRIWHVGCAMGEETYFMAILLKEESLYERCRIYATDISESPLKKARKGIYPLSFIQEMRRAGQSNFSDYYDIKHKHVVMHSSLKQNIVFAQHNLATDQSFNEFNMIFSRNALIYFKPSLQERVHQLFYESLCLFGFLSLGENETLQFSPNQNSYEAMDYSANIYRRIR